MADWDPERNFTKAKIMEFRERFSLERLSDSEVAHLMIVRKNNPLLFGKDLKRIQIEDAREGVSRSRHRVYTDEEIKDFRERYAYHSRVSSLDIHKIQSLMDQEYHDPIKFRDARKEEIARNQRKLKEIEKRPRRKR
jgi:hypothetical protein